MPARELGETVADTTGTRYDPAIVNGLASARLARVASQARTGRR